MSIMYQINRNTLLNPKKEEEALSFFQGACLQMAPNQFQNTASRR